MSQARTDGADAGYTLLELLVVLAIISMIVTAAPVIYQRLIPSYQARQFANDLADNLRDLRETARREGKVMQLAIDSQDGTVMSGTVHLTPPSGTTAVYKPSATADQSASTALLFFPSGASTGGTIEVKRQNLSVTVAIDWASGAIKVQQ